MLCRMRSIKDDRKMGQAGEEAVLHALRKLDPTLKKVSDKWARTDFIGDKIRVEHKTRNNMFNAFPTTLMPCDKAIPGDKPLYFSFWFTDGLYVIEYTPENFEGVEIAPFCRNARCDYVDKPAMYFHIPVDRLTRLV